MEPAGFVCMHAFAKTILNIDPYLNRGGGLLNCKTLTTCGRALNQNAYVNPKAYIGWNNQWKSISCSS